MPPPLIVITGPTASGKTRLAARVAASIDGEIISADSRQVYRGMDYGTGKDFADYMIDDKLVPYYLIDIVEPGHEYNVFEFQQDFLKAYGHIIKRHRQPILCGGTGMYIDAAIGGYHLQEVPRNEALRKKLLNYTWQELTDKLSSLRPLHNTTDTTSRERLLRAIEIEIHSQSNPKNTYGYPKLNPLIFCITLERAEIRQRITQRLKNRLDRGMVDEINKLLKIGIKPEQLMFYGLEYKYLTEYATGIISYDDMFRKLNTAIHQFAKRQMTWYRRMERKGFQIHWIDGNKNLEGKIHEVLLKLNQE